MSIVEIFFQIIAFLFAISVHESAHAWTANRCGDPTAHMLGRVTLNPIKHIDPVGTILLPAICMITHLPVFGWAKPTPVDPHNFRSPVRDDVFTSLAGPISNLLVAALAVLGLVIIAAVAPAGRQIVVAMAMTNGNAVSQLAGIPSIALPLAGMVYQLMLINVLLAVFNVIPIPPLDGSHVLRHLLPESLRRAYDMFGLIGLVLLFLVGPSFLGVLMFPVLNFFNTLLMRISA